MSGESYNNAYSVLENRRLAMRAKYFAKQDEINKKVPQVSQLTDEINHLGASYTLAVLGKNKQEAEKLNPGYYGEFAIWRDAPIEKIEEKLKDGVPFVLRFRSDGNHERM